MLMAVFDKDLPYLVQIGLWRSARVVVGIHGGNLGGALWLAPGQAIVELGMGGMEMEPTMYAHMAVANAAEYRVVRMDKGSSMEKGGTVNPRAVVHAVKEALL